MPSISSPILNCRAINQDIKTIKLFCSDTPPITGQTPGARGAAEVTSQPGMSSRGRMAGGTEGAGGCRVCLDGLQRSRRNLSLLPPHTWHSIGQHFVLQNTFYVYYPFHSSLCFPETK